VELGGDGRAVIASILTLALAIIGASAFELRLVDSAGQPVDLGQKDVLYLVDSWALECTPCMWELPDLAKLETTLALEPRVRFVSVLHGWPAKDLEKIRSRHGIPIQVHADPEGTLERLGCSAFPTKLLIRNAKVLDMKLGAGKTGNYESIMGWLRKWSPDLR
jgi:thiol-disulfide isomerase/thioredoxin